MRFAKEPLVHFLLLAALLFGLEQVFSSTQKDKIIVDQQTVEYLIKQREDLELRELGPEEREETIASFVEDEILYNEAYKRGLDRGDSRMRRNMILKMRGLLIGDLDQPTEEELRAYYQANLDQFTRPATISLDHVFFSDSAQVPQDLLEQLRGGLDHTTVGGALLGYGPVLRNMSQRMLVGTLGADSARAILAIDDDDWHGPFESSRGTLFVRVAGRTPESQPSYEQVKSYIEGYWTMAASRRLIEQELGRLQQNYEVIIEDPGGVAK